MKGFHLHMKHTHTSYVLCVFLCSFDVLLVVILSKLNCVGGKLYQLGQRWVVNASGGLESKGKLSMFCLFICIVGCPGICLNESQRSLTCC